MGQNGAKRILVAEDDPDVRELVVFRLVRAGYDVLAAADGEQAIALASSEHPDLCVIDIMMPGLDGYEVTNRLRSIAELARTPIVLLTASVQEAAIERGYAAGADAYVKKPFSPHELLDRIESLLADE